MDRTPKFFIGMLGPRYWITWLGFGLWWLIAQLPFRVQMAAGALLGRLMRRYVKRRVAIARRNLELCFPEMSAQEREDLLDKNMDAVGKAFFEIGIAWFMPHWRIRKLYKIEGLEHLQAAKERGQGVMLCALHLTHLDLGGGMVCLDHMIDTSYRSHKNAVYDWVQYIKRGRYDAGTRVIHRNNVRLMLKSLKEGRAIWYAPDQDYGRKHSVFVPFFGVEAATVTATSRFARMTGAAVIPFTHYRRSDNSGFDIKIYPPLENFPSDDEVADAGRVNKVLEELIRICPEQYLWPHRRFKTRPAGAPDLYASEGIAPSERDAGKA